ncbi:MAG: thioredoxin family protein [Desulfarculaceae bacterium]|nr:thioredoxin family protein [Desulfarculaceae bacterium]
MTKTNTILAAAVLLVCAVALPARAADLTGAIDWTEYESALSKAKEQDKKSFVYFYTDWCSYCEKVENVLFKDADVVEYLNENFVSTSVNVKGSENKRIAKDYGVSGFPTFWFLEEDNSKLNYLPGYIEKGKFLQILKYISTDSYETMEFAEFAESL